MTNNANSRSAASPVGTLTAAYNNMTSTSSATTVNGTVSGNTANAYGGGIALFFGTLTVNGTINGNLANGFGGGIYNQSGTFTLAAGHLIQGNHSDNDDNGIGSGGGISNGGVKNGAGNYGTGNYRGSGTGTSDDCAGVGCP